MFSLMQHLHQQGLFELKYRTIYGIYFLSYIIQSMTVFEI
jgi:hypothetical protein